MQSAQTIDHKESGGTTGLRCAAIAPATLQLRYSSFRTQSVPPAARFGCLMPLLARAHRASLGAQDLTLLGCHRAFGITPARRCLRPISANAAKEFRTRALMASISEQRLPGRPTNFQPSTLKSAERKRRISCGISIYVRHSSWSGPSRSDALARQLTRRPVAVRLAAVADMPAMRR